jgi:hypothetical protein
VSQCKQNLPEIKERLNEFKFLEHSPAARRCLFLAGRMLQVGSKGSHVNKHCEWADSIIHAAPRSPVVMFSHCTQSCCVQFLWHACILEARHVVGSFLLVQEDQGARGNVVVKALCYKPEGRGFDTRCGEFLNLPNPSGRTRLCCLLGH